MLRPSVPSETMRLASRICRESPPRVPPLPPPMLIVLRVLACLASPCSQAVADSDGVWTMLFKPAARKGHQSIYDPVTDRMFIFGGVGEDLAYHDDLWSVSLQGDAA